jgi:hypothetical protein
MRFHTLPKVAAESLTCGREFISSFMSTKPNVLIHPVSFISGMGDATVIRDSAVTSDSLRRLVEAQK